MINIRKFLTALGLVPVSSTGIDSKGEMEVLSTGGKLNYHNGTTASPMVTESHASTLTNKTIDADSNTITNIENADIKAGAAIDASKIGDGSVSTVEFQYINTLSSNAQTQITANATAISDHIVDPTDAHAGTAITNTPSGNLSATTVQAALNELQTDVDTRATSAALTAHISNSTGAHAASAISFTPVGTIAATDTQTAVAEVATDAASALASHEIDTTAVHGIADTSVLVTLSGTQALTNKDFQGGTASNTSRITVPSATKATLDALTRKEATIVYATDTDKLYTDDGVTLNAIGSGTGNINYITSTDGTAIGAWATYADAAGTSPVDGTGGSPASTFAVSSDSSLVGANNFIWTKSAANRQGEGFSYAFSIDQGYQSTPMTISMLMKVASGTYADNDMSVWIYDVTNSTLIQPSAYLIKNSSLAQTIKCEFQAASNSTSYRLIVHTGSTSALAYSLRFDQFSVSPNTYNSGEVVTNDAPTSITPSAAFGTTTAQSTFVRRVGNVAYFRGHFKSGTVAGSIASFALPAGYVVDSSKITSTASAQQVGTWRLIYNAAGPTISADYSLFYDGSDTANIYFGYRSGSNVMTKDTGTTIFATNDGVTYEFSIPVLGWGTTQVLSSETDTRVVAMDAVKSGGAITANTAIPSWTLVNKDTHGALNATTGLYTIPVPGDYIIAFNIATTSGTPNPVILKNGSIIFLGPAATFLGWTTKILSGLVAGDTIAIASNTSLTVATGTNPYFTNFSISRISGPAQVAASEKVLASAVKSAGSATANTAISSWTSVLKDTHGAFNSSTGVFTVPSPGDYTVTGIVNVTSGTPFLSVYKNGTAQMTASAANSPLTYTISNCVAGDTLTIAISSSLTISTSTAPYFTAVQFSRMKD